MVILVAVPPVIKYITLKKSLKQATTPDVGEKSSRSEVLWLVLCVPLLVKGL